MRTRKWRKQVQWTRRKEREVTECMYGGEREWKGIWKRQVETKGRKGKEEAQKKDQRKGTVDERRRKDRDLC